MWSAIRPPRRSHAWLRNASAPIHCCTSAGVDGTQCQEERPLLPLVAKHAPRCCAHAAGSKPTIKAGADLRRVQARPGKQRVVDARPARTTRIQEERADAARRIAAGSRTTAIEIIP